MDEGQDELRLWPLGTIWALALVAKFGGMLMWVAMVVGGPTDVT